MNPLVITFVTACTALMAATVGPFITFRIGKAQINAAVLSANRQKWIDGFRDLVATFCSQVIAAMYLREKLLDGGRTAFAQDPELLRRLEQLMLTLTRIKLMIKPNEADHDALIALLGATMMTLRTTPADTDLESDMEIATDKIVAITQTILKREWIRVKRGQ